MPEKAIHDVLRRLAEAAKQLSRMPYQGETAEVYGMLAQALMQAESSWRDRMSVREIIGDFVFIALLFADGFYRRLRGLPPRID